LPDSNVILIGLDGGATEAKAHAVHCDDPERPERFTLRPESAGRVYAADPGFAPVPVVQQFSERAAQPLPLTDGERAAGGAWVAAAAAAIADVARACGATRVRVGVGMPGLKTADGRGIEVINNGPRIPDYLERLEAALRAAGVEPAAPIARLGSDADYCGLGEEYAADGCFRDVADAYYAGCGTGVADALKLDGTLVPFDAAKAWIQKSWQLSSALGPTFEKLISAASLNAAYQRLLPAAQAGPARFPERDAGAGSRVAETWLRTAGLVLAELFFERITTLFSGRAEAPHRSAGYLALDRAHPFRGTILKRLVLGQRLAQIGADAALGRPLMESLRTSVAELLQRSGEPALIEGYLTADGTLRDGLLVCSRVRAAPALGAAIDAARSIPR